MRSEVVKAVIQDFMKKFCLTHLSIVLCATVSFSFWLAMLKVISQFRLRAILIPKAQFTLNYQQQITTTEKTNKTKLSTKLERETLSQTQIT